MTETYSPEFFAGRREMVMPSAQAVAAVVKDMLAPTSLLDVGCGQGEWIEAFGIEDSLGVDIAAPEGEGFMRHDVTERLWLGRKFDLVVCLEVAEHIPLEGAHGLIDMLVGHGDIVLFSAAVPGQEGKGHINCQPHKYWHRHFEIRDYDLFDTIRPRIANNWRVSPWYRENIFLYISARRPR